MFQQEIQVIGQLAIENVADQYQGLMNTYFRASTTPTKDACLLQVFVANGNNTREKVYTWGTLSHDDYQLTNTDLQQMLETFVARCVMDFWSKTNNDLATLARWRDRSRLDNTH